MSIKSEDSPDLTVIEDDSFRLTKSVKKSHKRYRKHQPSVGDEVSSSTGNSRSRTSGESREEKRERTTGGNRGAEDSRIREEKRRRQGGDERSSRDKGRDIRTREKYDRERIKKREERFYGEPRTSRSPIPRPRYDYHYDRSSGYKSREGRSPDRSNMDTRKRSKGKIEYHQDRKRDSSTSDSEEDSRRKKKKQDNNSESIYVRSLIQDLDSHSSSSITSDSEGTPLGDEGPSRTPRSPDRPGDSDNSQPKIKSWKDIANESSESENDLVDSDNKKMSDSDTKFSQLSENFLKYSEAVSSSEIDEPDTNKTQPTDSAPSEQPMQDESSDEVSKDNKEEKMEEEIEEEEVELPPYLPALMGCRSVECFEWLNKIEEGTYGVVFRAKEKKTGEVVALKKLKMEKEREGFPITSLREINMLLKASHPNIVHVREIVVGSNMDKIYIVMDYVEHDLKSLMEVMKQPFLEGEVKTLMIQLLRAVHHMHDNWILHRDLKTSNLLLSHKGILKVADFGLAREYGSPLKKYTPIVVTLWYRCPELLLGAKEYSTAVDIWSVGCIFAELLHHKPLFMGKSEIDQLNQIFKELGTPSNDIWPGYNELPVAKKVSFSPQPLNNLRKRFPLLTNSGFNLLNKLLTYDPKRRITAEDGLQHVYFEESPLPVDPNMFPTWPAKSEMVKKTRQRSPSAPEGGAFLLNKLKEKDDPTDEAKLRASSTQPSKGAGFSLKF